MHRRMNTLTRMVLLLPIATGLVACGSSSVSDTTSSPAGSASSVSSTSAVASSADPAASVDPAAEFALLGSPLSAQDAAVATPVDRAAVVCVDFLCPPAGELVEVHKDGLQLLYADGVLVRVTATAGSLGGVEIGSKLADVRRSLGSPVWSLVLNEVVHLFEVDGHGVVVQTGPLDEVTAVSLCDCLPPLTGEGNDQPPTLFATQPAENVVVAADERPHTRFLVAHPFRRDGSVNPKWSSVPNTAPADGVHCAQNPGVSGVPDSLVLCEAPGGSQVQACVLDEQQGAVTCMVDQVALTVSKMKLGALVQPEEFAPLTTDTYAPFSVVTEDGVVSAAGDKRFSTLEKTDALWTVGDGTEQSPAMMVDAAVWVQFDE